MTTSCPFAAVDGARADRRMVIHDEASEALAQWPALAAAEQPAVAMFGSPAPRWLYREKAHRVLQLAPVQVMAELADRGLYKITGVESRLVGPFPILGACLWPLVRPGDRVYVDPTIKPRDGDLVLLKLGDARMRGIIERGLAVFPDFRASYGGLAMSNLCVKVFWRIDGRPMAFEREGCEYVAGDIDLLGVVGRVERDGRPLFG